MNTRSIAVLAAVLGMVAIAAGCGSGNDSSATTITTASIGKAQFVKQAESICKAGQDRTSAALATFSKRTGNAKGEISYPQYVATVIKPNIEKEVEEFRQLGAPSGDEEKIEAILNALEKAVEQAEKNPTGFVKGEIDPYGQARELTGKYGFAICAER